MKAQTWDEYDLKGKTVLITGGSSGIGKKIADFLLNKGCIVIIVSSNKMKLENAFKELQKNELKGDLKYFNCDITNDKEIDILVEFLNKNKIKLNILINCAAILGPVGIFEDNSFEEWKRTIDTNLIGNALIIQKMIPLLLKTKYPKVINLGGGGAGYPRLYHTAYAASKTAMVRLTEILAEEYRNKIDFNIIAPGAHKTPIWDKETYDPEPEEWADDNKLFGLISFLSSSNSNGITGRFIHIENDWKSLTSEISNTSRFQLRRTD